MGDEHPAVLVLDALEELEDTVHDGVAEDGLLRLKVALPAAHLLQVGRLVMILSHTTKLSLSLYLEHQFAKDGQSAVVKG